MDTDTPKKIYVVTQGSYSDYRIIATYDNKEDADECAAQYGPDAMIEEYDLNPSLPYERGVRKYEVYMNKDGNADIYEGTCNSESIFFHRSTGEIVASFVVLCRGDSDLAVKIANERRVMLIASGEWDKAEEQLNDSVPFHSIDMPEVWKKVRES